MHLGFFSMLVVLVALFRYPLVVVVQTHLVIQAIFRIRRVLEIRLQFSAPIALCEATEMARNLVVATEVRFPYFTKERIGGWRVFRQQLVLHGVTGLKGAVFVYLFFSLAIAVLNSNLNLNEDEKASLVHLLACSIAQWPIL